MALSHVQPSRQPYGYIYWMFANPNAVCAAQYISIGLFYDPFWIYQLLDYLWVNIRENLGDHQFCDVISDVCEVISGFKRETAHADDIIHIYTPSIIGYPGMRFFTIHGITLLQRLRMGAHLGPTELQVGSLLAPLTLPSLMMVVPDKAPEIIFYVLWKMMWLLTGFNVDRQLWLPATKLTFRARTGGN